MVVPHSNSQAGRGFDSRSGTRTAKSVVPQRKRMEMARYMGTHDTYGNRVVSSLDFFNGLERGEMVRSGLYGSPLVYTANWKESMMRHTVFLVTQVLSEPFFVDVENDGSNWSVVTDDNNGLPIKQCPDACYAIDQYIAEWKGNKNLHDVIAKLRNDIRRINDELNSTAEEQSWCNEYEERLDRLNETLSTETTLVGRKRDRNVRVSVTATWDVYLTVEATSEEDAIEQIRNMDADEVYRKARDIQREPDQIDVDDI